MCKKVNEPIRSIGLVSNFLCDKSSIAVYRSVSQKVTQKVSETGSQVLGYGVLTAIWKPKRFAAHPPPTDRLKRKKKFSYKYGTVNFGKVEGGGEEGGKYCIQIEV